MDFLRFFEVNTHKLKTCCIFTAQKRILNIINYGKQLV